MANQLNRDQLINELENRIGFYSGLIAKMPDNKPMLVIKMEPLQEQRDYLLTNYLTLTAQDLQKANNVLADDDGVDITGTPINTKKSGWLAAIAIAAGIGYGVYAYLKYKKKNG